ncbi:hypothetical protein llap_879 [Limosa lapponica baueri]|uniref:Uncharacterized protein n=1 Tax=Limosa lapponica baueri TaxID=1758121 RepID=A0A2I0URX8_LIMLA|nr:hypothetical protein llap_879 [Limosa lapponica baueri]
MMDTVTVIIAIARSVALNTGHKRQDYCCQADIQADEDIWWVQSSTAVTCWYGDHHSPGKFSCLLGNEGMVKLSSLAGNGWVATLKVDHINVVV